MKQTSDSILTTHVGSLVRPPVIIGAMSRAEQALPYDDAKYEADLTAAVATVVRKQADIGIDIPDDGEFGKRIRNSLLGE